MSTSRSRLALVLVAAVASTIFTAAAHAVPPQGRVSTVQCQGSSVSLILYPGQSAAAFWDISVADVQNAPSYLLEQVAGEVFVNGQSTGTFSFSFGNKTGLGDPLVCTWQVHEADFDAYGTSELVRL